MTAARGALRTAPRDLQEFVASLDSRGTSAAIVAFDASGTEEISYTEIAHRARRFGGHLAEHMVENRRVIILAPPSPNHIAAALGAFYAGVCVVPLDTQLPEDMLRHIVEDSDSSHVITTAVHAERVKKLFSERPLQYFLLDSQPDTATYWLPETAVNDCSPGNVVDESAVAALFYTSGTTGKPKGVPLTHANLIFQINTIGERQLLGPGSRVLLPLPLHHVYPFVLGILAPLALGATMVLPLALTGPQLSRALIDAEVTHLIGVPRLYEALLSTIWAQLRERNKLAYGAFGAAFAFSRWIRLKTGLHIGKQLLWPLHKRIGSKLRVMASGGAPLPESLAAELEAFGWKVSIGYGLTETSPLITLTPPGKGKTGSVGKVIDGIELRIAPVAQVPAPQGEIQVRGPGVFRGYYKLPEKTRQAFTKDGWFRTGDLGRLNDDGYLYLTGRLSTLIVTPGGENVQPDQLEELYSEHPVIKEIGIFPHGKGLAGVIVPNTAVITVDKEKGIEQVIRDAVQDRSENLASYQRLNDFVISREDLARTQIGKIKRPQLRARFEDLTNTSRRNELELAAPLPIYKMSEHDRALLELDAPARVWDWLAKAHPHAELSPNTDLRLELAVDSLDWVEITQTIREITGIELNEQAIAQIHSIRDLLTAVAGAAQDTDRTVLPAGLFDKPEIALSESQLRWLKPLPKLAIAIAWLIYHGNRLLMSVLFRVRVTGLDNLAGKSVFILAPNHTSLLDPFALGAVLSFAQVRRTYWAGLTRVVFTKLWRRIGARLVRVIPVEPARPASSLAAATAVLQSRGSLIWFPEGKLSPSGELQAFKPGIGLLLEHIDVPVVPVYIDGANRALPPGKRRIHLHPIQIRIGKPLSRDSLIRQGEGVRTRDRIANALRDEVKKLE